MDFRDIEIGKVYKYKIYNNTYKGTVCNKEICNKEYIVYIKDSVSHILCSIKPKDIIDPDSNINIPEWKPNVNNEDIQTLSKAIDICLDSGDKVLLSSLTRLKNKLTYYVLENAEKVECEK